MLPEGREQELGRLAEANGLFGVLVGAGEPLTAINAAVYASTATEFARVIVRLSLGLEHPVLIAEELAVLDNVNNGRTVVLADTGELDEEAADDEIAVLREALSGRPLQHEGPVWKVPAGLPANVTAPKSISVTPKPAQVEVPFWVTGTAAGAIGARRGLPALAQSPADIDPASLLQPARDGISGDLERDRERLTTWAKAGVTHLLIDLPEGPADELMTLVARHLSPEVGMPHFPRVMSESRVPLPWPGER